MLTRVPPVMGVSLFARPPPGAALPLAALCRPRKMLRTAPARRADGLRWWDGKATRVRKVAAAPRASFGAEADGYLEGKRGKIHWRANGSNDAIPPLVVLHGGPGVPHNYLLPLTRMAHMDRAGRRVVFYDQVGCGKSDRPGEEEVEWTVEAAVEEAIDVLSWVRGEYGGRSVHLLGQSWGGILAYEVAARLAKEGRGEWLASLVLSNTPSDVEQLEAEAAKLMEALPDHLASALTVGPEEAGEAFHQAYAEFMARHNCRAAEVPGHVEEAYAAGGTVFRGSGAIGHWKASAVGGDGAPWPGGLHTLLISGEHDFVTPPCVEPWLQMLPRSTWELLPDASHMPFNDDFGSEAYIDLLHEFLEAHD